VSTALEPEAAGCVQRRVGDQVRGDLDGEDDEVEQHGEP
jgi:hypothetical protein